MTKQVTVLFAAVLALSGCKHDGTGAAPGAPQGARATSPAIAELLAGVPGSAVALGFFDMVDAPLSLVTGGGPFPLDDAARKALDQELRDYVTRYLGLDVSKLQYAVGFVSGPPLHAAVLLKTVGGAPKMPGARDYEGGKLWVVDPDRSLSLAIRDGIVVFGEDTAVHDVLDTQAGKRKPVTVDNKPLVDWLREQTPGAVLGFATIRPKTLPLPGPIAGLERVAASISAHGIAAVVDGDDASISALQAQSDQAFANMLAEVEQAHTAAQAGTINPLEGAGAIIGAAYARSYAARLKPRRTGNRLSASLDLGLADTGAASAVTAVTVIGILSAVAIPAFMDYTKRSKRPEAALNLNKLGKNAKRVYSEMARFPAGTAPLTPPRSCCGQPNNHCAAVPALYAADPTWVALDFQIDEPTLFQYSYTASADGQRFVAQAIGDLDCDGIPITYELVGTVENGNPRVTLTEPAPNSD
jgi:type II secretory pathway pseudopilin PulG